MNSYARSLTLALILAAGPSAGIAQVTPDQTRALDSPATPAAKSAADLQANMQANMQKMHSLMSRKARIGHAALRNDGNAHGDDDGNDGADAASPES
jgi:hypothetical protein